MHISKKEMENIKQKNDAIDNKFNHAEANKKKFSLLKRIFSREGSNMLDEYLGYFQEADNPKVKIPVEHPGVLEVPEGKSVEDLPVSHFKKLIKKKGWPKVSRALINLKVWNREKNPSLSSWADRMQERLAKTREGVKESYMLEADPKVKIPVEHPGLLEVPEGEDVENLPISHFKKLVKKKGWEAISKGLINLKVWNRKRNPSLSSWADKMQEKLAKWREGVKEQYFVGEEEVPDCPAGTVWCPFRKRCIPEEEQRSNGMGRGLGRGQGAGPMGVPSQEGLSLAGLKSIMEAGFTDKPKGWTDQSVKKYEKTFTSKMKGDVKSKGFFDKCVEKMKGKVDNPEGFCAALKDEAYGSTFWRGKGKTKKQATKDVRAHKNV